MLVIADASPLRYLIVIEEAHVLPAIFGDIWIPGVVIRELSDTATPSVVRQVIENRPAWLLSRDPSGDVITDMAVDLDPGERAALALAREMNADLVLIDDAAGRREAKALGIRTTGTIGVLRLAAERGLIDVPRVVARLRSSGFYIHDSVMHAAFAQWL